MLCKFNSLPLRQRVTVRVLVVFQDSGVGTPVTLRLDERGFYLYWTDQNKVQCLLYHTSVVVCMFVLI